MCRNFNVFLSPVQIEQLFFSRKQDNGHYGIRSRDEIMGDLRSRTSRAREIAEDCSKKSTKAGYDASGMAVSYISVDGLLAQLEQRRQQAEQLGSDEVSRLIDELQAQMSTSVRVARDGGDLLKTWPMLEQRLDLFDEAFITNWETHVRQASQGDMYSESNAHPHRDVLSREQITIYRLSSADELAATQQPRTGGETLFYDTHNGDINDATRYKRFLMYEGFEFFSNSDSCVEPALKRFVYEHLQAGELAGALHRLAYTDPDFLDATTVTVDSHGYIAAGNYVLGPEWANQQLDVAVAGTQITFSQGQQSAGSFVQHGFLYDDDRSAASEKIAELLALADTMAQESAQQVTIAAALTARILEYSRPDNKFVFQSFTPMGQPGRGLMSSGSYATVRGGTERGGEEGGEIVFHVPKSYDERNYGRVALLSASEENALKEQVALLDAAALEQGQFQLAQPESIEIHSLHNVQARAWITEGVAPIFDVLPGEVVEATSDGRVRLFDIYHGHSMPLVTIDERTLYADDAAAASSQEPRPKRRERLAALKVFRIEYFDMQGNPIECPYNKYGEEIIVIQPLALRRNTEKLFAKSPDGKVTLRTGPDGLGLTMGTSDEALLRQRVKDLTHVITGAAGTSHLINTVAAEVSRKLCLNTLPVMKLDGFTGSDTIPAYVGSGTFMIANSNSGGTSDTIKLTHELAGLPGVLTRIEEDLQRRPADLPEVRETREHLAAVRAALAEGQTLGDLPEHLRAFLGRHTPWIYVVTNIEASALGNIGRGVDKFIRSAAGCGITNLPEEECVGSTFAAMASLQWQIALYTYMGELRGDISPEYAAGIYAELAQLPDVAEQIVGDAELLTEIESLADEFVGGNFDFVFTGYLDGVAEEQAHKAAEMIQEMFAGWHFFLFQHGKYAHMKRRTRHTLGSILGHNAPPPSWPVFNARALKSPREIGPRVATSFVVAHRDDHDALRAIPEYAPDFIFTYPADSMVLYPFQAIIISHLISYFWGLKKKQLGETIRAWNDPFVAALLATPAEAAQLDTPTHAQVQQHARTVLQEFLTMCETKHHFDNIEGRRKTAIVNGLALLANGVGAAEPARHSTDYVTGGFLRGTSRTLPFSEQIQAAGELDDAAYLDVLKDMAVELCNTEQAKRLADHFLIDEGRTLSRKITVARPHNRTRTTYEYDYLIEYEGLGTFYDVEPVHPPKIAKAKKGWL